MEGGQAVYFLAGLAAGRVEYLVDGVEVVPQVQEGQDNHDSSESNKPGHFFSPAFTTLTTPIFQGVLYKRNQGQLNEKLKYKRRGGWLWQV